MMPVVAIKLGGWLHDGATFGSSEQQRSWIRKETNLVPNSCLSFEEVQAKHELC
jgi:hypothetical protein